MRPLALLAAVALSTVAIVGAGRRAYAGPCPTVMVILDRSGSMSSNPSGGSSPPSKLDIAKTALGKLFMQYGDRLPFGFISFASTGFDCDVGVNVSVKPKHGTRADVTAALAAVMTEGSTNTGPAIDAAIALPEMKDDTRPGSYILLVTDGEPNCAGMVGTETTDPAYTVGAVKRAAQVGIKTFVIGFGALPDSAKTTMNQMAVAGQVPCTGATCAGQMFYAAESDAGLQAAIDSISEVIVGEFGGQCDDSCYANGCPNGGEICVNGMCKPDPCNGVRSTCAPSDYCYTDGTSPGTCTPVCPATCPPGQSCTLGGCAIDPCNGVVCDPGAYCKNGSCVAGSCGMSCPDNLFCLDGKCKDDPCRYVICPMGASCESLKGTCAGILGGDGTGGRHGRGEDCHFAPGEHPDQATALVALGALALVLALRLRRARG